MKRSLRIAALIYLAVGATLAGAQVTQQGSGYLFRVHLAKGEKLQFRIPFTISGIEGMNLRFGMRLKVLRLSREGVATLHCDVDTGSMHLPGISPKGGDFSVDQRGRVNVEEGNPPLGFCIIYPKEPVPVGGKFIASVPAALGGNLSGSGNTSQATFKFLGFSGSGIHKVARFTFTVEGNKDPGGSILVRVSDGVIDKYYTKFVAIPAQTQSQVTVTATIIRM
jgi:hypothetical protein